VPGDGGCRFRREALFSALLARRGNFLGVRVLDLYAGSGALGLEAISRGASLGVLVESGQRAAVVARANAQVVSCASAQVSVVRQQVGRFLAAGSDLAGPGFDLVFSDPPYELPDAAVQADLVSLVEHGWLAPQADVVVERSVRSAELLWPAGLDLVCVRRYGETSLWYGGGSR
jgi:16S rRNA (guanine966-N2)-methyltransferase